VNPLIPKPGTAYQWLPMGRSGDHGSQGQATAHARRGSRQRVLQHQVRAALVLPGAALARRPPRGAGDSKPPSGTAASGARPVAETGVDADFYIFRDRSGDAVLPWDIIDGGMKSQFFRAEFDKGLKEEWTLPPKRAAENKKFLPVLS